MLIVELIAQKQRGDELRDDQIQTLIEGFTRGDVPDYQMSAMLMAIYFRGLTDSEGRAFLKAMIDSGTRLSLASVAGVKVDKHSTGGVGDKTSLIVAPVVAAAGVPVPMISGRALGHTGGTLDKLESIPGFRVRLDDEEFERILRTTHLAFGAPTAELVPADRKLYALRDVTSTVEIPPLIAASILSKKMAEGANALVMDVKVGSGGFLPDEAVARALAQTLVRWSAAEHLRTIVFGTDMERPLGTAAGNAPEVIECLNVLRTGRGDQRLVTLCRILGGGMLWLGGKANDLREGMMLFTQILSSGAGFEKMKEVAQAQGSSPDVIERFESHWQPRHQQEIRARRAGILHHVETRDVGYALVDLGAGRRKASDTVDPTAGAIFDKQLGDEVKAGERLATAFWSDAPHAAEGMARLENALTIGDEPPLTGALVRFYCDDGGVTAPETVLSADDILEGS